MSARDVLAASLWLIDREIAGAPLPHPSWETFRENDPETAMIYETQAGCHLAALAAAGWVVEQGWRTMETAPRDGTVIDLFCEGERWADCYWGLPDHCCGEAGQYCDSDWHRMKHGWIVCSINAPAGLKPTHWRPLPAAPQEERDDGR